MQKITIILIKKNWLTDCISCLFILLFIYAAISKLLIGSTFKQQISQSPLLTSYASLIAILLPLTELTLSILLINSKTRLVALYGCFGLMTLLTLYIAAITNFSDYIPCSCGGILESMSWDQHLIFNCFFVFLAIVAILLYKPAPTRS